MFRHSRHAVPSRSSLRPTASSSSAAYDVGVRQALDEHRSVGALVGVIMLCVGGVMIASAHRQDVHAYPVSGAACTPAGCDANPPVDVVAATTCPEDIQMARSVLKDPGAGVGLE